MKKSVKEKFLHEANNQLFFLLGILFLIFLISLRFQPQRSLLASVEKFAELEINQERYLLDLRIIQKAKTIKRYCPATVIEQLDKIIIFRDQCELKKGRASNWVRLVEGKKMLLNNASISELEFLSGIGPKRAQELWHLIQETGGVNNFSSLEKLPWMNKQIKEEIEKYFSFSETE